MIGLSSGDSPTARGADVDIEGDGDPGFLMYESSPIEAWQNVSEPGQVFAKFQDKGMEPCGGHAQRFFNILLA